MKNLGRLLLLLAALCLAPACGGSGGVATPSLSVSTSSLFFAAKQSGPAARARSVIVSNTGDLGTFLDWTASSDQSWLTVSPSSGSLGAGMSATLSVSVNAILQTEAWTGATSTVGAPGIASTGWPGWGVWTGNAMLIWGGDQGTPGKFYDPVSDTWYGSTTTIGAPDTRTLFTAVWTGTEMIVWGGITAWGGTPMNTGARYNVAADTWTPVSTVGAPSVRFAHSAVWTGSKMIVWGGDSGGYSYKNSGGIYDPSTDTWSSTTTTGAPTARGYCAAVWDGTRMIVWGGEDPSKFNTGYYYDLALDTWTGTTSTVGAPAARSHMPGCWTGQEMIIWGGGSGGPHLNTGGRYNPANDTWVGATTTTGAPAGRASFLAVWTGSRMIVWGGEINGTATNTGGIYQPPIPNLGLSTGTITISAAGVANSPQTMTVGLNVTP